MDIKNNMREGFKDLQGGLFASVHKADVGNAVSDLMKRGVDLMCWADPFFPDLVIPQNVKQSVIDSIDKGMATHYTMPIGNSDLKQAIAVKLQEDNHMSVDPDRNILITPGSDSGLMFAMMPFIGEGDEVLIPAPSYPSNFLNPKLLGGIAIPVPLKEENNYQIEIEEFEKRVSPQTKMVLLTNPNNPTSTVLRRDSLEKIAKFVIEHDLVLVVDQAFEDAIYDDIEFVSIATLPGMWERTISVFSISKGMGLSGFRVGYLIADDKIIDVLYGCTVNVIGATNTSAQIGAIAAMKDRSFVKEYNAIFDRRRKVVYEIMNSIPGVSMAMPESGFLSWVNISQLGTSAEISKYLIDHANVVVNEGTPYGVGGEGYIRIVHGCYKDDNVLYTALERIKQALIQLDIDKGVAAHG
ncbi:aminotransferase [Bacillus sp. FJAT-27264]|uniref:pyridoxal phosphate-dependent aminotransferase n=1 Tax=Paenibacillus sp. (strain DSM 101736 / FJAT-27264) TaxID=1850362 RepID=UPI000807A97D|nr:pyridoxal phosphate-dependent aminotransferase [Bacillus sp. FJAT-27264]OBZ08374.1 aminotransferase [Bacillus sp. FJAT-27264]